ncbi:MAG: GIY-YIG nuclease family protein [Nitrososphaerales archaeon]
MHLKEDVELKVGSLGYIKFDHPYYIYTGSALGNRRNILENRILRHLRRKKRKFWHIDYITESEKFQVEKVILAETNERLECEISRALMENFSLGYVKRFGNSDCKNCESHLIKLDSKDHIKKLLYVYKKLGLKPKILNSSNFEVKHITIQANLK